MALISGNLKMRTLKQQRRPALPASRPSLIDAWNAAAVAERVAFGRAFGVDRVWNDAIAVDRGQRLCLTVGETNAN
jgi:hypothetical protein